MKELYDQIGHSYTTQRRPEPRIAAAICQQLGNISSLLNVGAGSGSYEPLDLAVTAVEPSTRMITLRWNRSNVVQARAEALPFNGNSFDAAMAVLTIHHWKNKKKGLQECARVVRKRIVILTWDPESAGFWLVQDYFPGLLAFDRRIFPGMEELEEIMGPISIEPLPIPANCIDGFLGAYWRRPYAYLHDNVRSGMSTFSRISGVKSQIRELHKDLASGLWERKNRQLLDMEELDIGYRLITADL